MESLVLRLELGLLSNPTLSLTPVSVPLLILGPLPRFWPPVSLAPSHLTHILRARKRSGGGKKGRNTWERLCIQGKLHDSRLITGEGNGTPLQYSCLENPMDGGAWWAAVHGVTRSWTWLSDFTLYFHFHALEKEMATHSSVLAWRIPGTGKPGGLPFMGSHRVGHDWSDLAAAADKSHHFPLSPVKNS